MFEPGQNWKIAALRSSKCVCFFYDVPHGTLQNKFMFHVKHYKGDKK